jgi:RNA polymerase sigma-70 factor (ECF subfamily)
MFTNHPKSKTSLPALQYDSPEALNRIIAQWQRPLLDFAYRYTQNFADAQDLVAETFVSLHQQRARLRADTNLSAWLFTALTNRCHNHYRWKRRHPIVGMEFDADLHPSPEAAPNASFAQKETLGLLRKAIDALPHELKVTVLLHHYEHLSYREIAGITGCSERGVETRLYRAKQQLKKDLSGVLTETPSVIQVQMHTLRGTGENPSPAQP